MSKNITYASEAITRFYSRSRTRWDQFYPSERWVFEAVAAERGGNLGDVLDIGCAAGGLGHALAERFTLGSYTGIDIHEGVIAAARTRPVSGVQSRFFASDIVDCAALDGTTFNTVASLGAADWNVETRRMIDRGWAHVARGGVFVISLRLTDALRPGETWQAIAFEDGDMADAERAPYVVFTLPAALRLLGGLDPRPAGILGYGYWGRPSETACTPYDRLVFTVFAVTKAEESGEVLPDAPRCILHLPLDALAPMPD